jgi:hypothetical protein
MQNEITRQPLSIKRPVPAIIIKLLHRRRAIKK